MGRIFGRCLIVLLPLAITVLIIQFVVKTIDSVFLPFIDPLVGPDIPGLGLLLFIVIVFVLGVLSHRIAESFGRTIERGIRKVPLIAVFYLTGMTSSLSVAPTKRMSLVPVDRDVKPLLPEAMTTTAPCRRLSAAWRATTRSQ